MFDQEKYLNLLCAIAPKPIESEEQYDYYLKLVEPFFSGDYYSPEQTAIYSVLCLLIEQYEEKHYSTPELEPLEFLKGMMESLEVTVDDLTSVIGDSNLTKLILNGAFEIDKPIAKVLGEYFGVDYKHFL